MNAHADALRYDSQQQRVFTNPCVLFLQAAREFQGRQPTLLLHAHAAVIYFCPLKERSERWHMEIVSWQSCSDRSERHFKPSSNC